MGGQRPTVILVAAAVMVAGCSSKKAAPALPVSTTLPVTTSSAPPRLANTDPFCGFLTAYNERFGRINLGLAEPQAFKAAIEQAVAAVNDAQSAAPAELKADLAVLTGGLQRLLTILGQANYDLTKVTAADLQMLQAPAFAAAATRVDTYTRDHCR